MIGWKLLCNGLQFALTVRLKCFVLKNIRVLSSTCGEWAPSCLLSHRCSSSTLVTMYSARETQTCWGYGWCVRCCSRLMQISPQHFLLAMMPTWLSLPAYVWTESLQDWRGSLPVYSKCEGVWTLGHLWCTQYSAQSKVFGYKIILSWMLMFLVWESRISVWTCQTKLEEEEFVCAIHLQTEPYLFYVMKLSLLMVHIIMLY